MRCILWWRHSQVPEGHTKANVHRIFIHVSFCLKRWVDLRIRFCHRSIISSIRVKLFAPRQTLTLGIYLWHMYNVSSLIEPTVFLVRVCHEASSVCNGQLHNLRTFVQRSHLQPPICTNGQLYSAVIQSEICNLQGAFENEHLYSRVLVTADNVRFY